MKRMHNPVLTSVARELRKNMTPQEQRLWYRFLWRHPVKFRRQAVIGRFIADFYSPAAKLVIELDGSQHYSPNGIEHDRERTVCLEQYGLTVIRFSNREIDSEFEAVCEQINHMIFARKAIPPPA